MYNPPLDCFCTYYARTNLCSGEYGVQLVKVLFFFTLFFFIMVEIQLGVVCKKDHGLNFSVIFEAKLIDSEEYD